MNLDKNIAFGILAIALIAVGAYVYVNSDKQMVNVSGASEISAEPDFVSVYVTIDTVNKSAEDSKNANSEISSRVVNALKSSGVSEKNIETVSYNIYQDYSWDENKQTLKGWKTTNQIKVKSENYKLVGNIIDKAVDNGAIISYINFELNPENESKFKADAIEAATRDAKTKAEAVAKGSGKRIGSLISISTNDYNYMPYNYYTAKSMDFASNSEARAAATQISPQKIKISANVQAVYSI